MGRGGSSDERVGLAVAAIGKRERGERRSPYPHTIRAHVSGTADRAVSPIWAGYGDIAWGVWTQSLPVVGRGSAQAGVA